MKARMLRSHRAVRVFGGLLLVSVAVALLSLVQPSPSWAAEVLGDQQLARGLRKLERAAATGATPDRTEILAHIEDQYMVGNRPHDLASGRTFAGTAAGHC